SRNQFRRDEPRAGEICHGANGVAGAGLAASARATVACIARKNRACARITGSAFRSAGLSDLQQEIEQLFETKPSSYTDEQQQVFFHFRDLLNQGAIRSAEPDASQPTGWRVNVWVKKGILLGFRIGGVIEMSGAGPLPFFDKSTYPVKTFTVD